jgi:hypothetical protein
VRYTIANEPRHTKWPVVEEWCVQAWPFALSSLLVNIPRHFLMVAQASKHMTSAQKLKQQKLMEADVSEKKNAGAVNSKAFFASERREACRT